MRHALFTLLILFASQAQAQVYKCVVKLGNGVDGVGSCVAIDLYQNNEQAFLTAGHVVTREKLPVKVFVDGVWQEATVRGVEWKGSIDLAALTVRCREIKSAAKIARTEPSPGQRVAVVGFPFGGRGVCRWGNVLSNYPDDLACNAAAQQGQSGGGIFDQRNQLVSIISAGDFGKPPTFGTRTQYLCRFVRRIWGQPFQPPSDQPPYVPEERPTQSEVIRGPQGPPGPPGESWNREIVRSWVESEVKRQVAAIPLPRGPQGPRGPKGDPGIRGEAGPQGPPGQSYDPAELDELKQRVSDLENKPSTVIVEPKAEPRDIVIKVVDENGKEVTVPVTVKPNQSRVTIPIVRD